MVWVETLTGEQKLEDPIEVGTYAQAFDALLAASAAGDAAIEVIRAAQQQLQHVMQRLTRSSALTRLACR